MFRWVVLFFLLTGCASVPLEVGVSSIKVAPIFCPKCSRHLYDYHGELGSSPIVEASDFTAVDASRDPIDGDRMICEFDSAPLNGYEYWFWSRGRGKPRFAYGAVTLMTIDDNGEFVFKPYEVELTD